MFNQRWMDKLMLVRFAAPGVVLEENHVGAYNLDYVLHFKTGTRNSRLGLSGERTRGPAVGSATGRRGGYNDTTMISVMKKGKAHVLLLND